MREINFIILHHSGTPAKENSFDNQGKGIVSAILREHKEKWIKEFPNYISDYHYIVGLTGKVFEGQPLEYPGWHATNYQVNLKSIGVCFLGNFEKDKMPKPQFEEGVKLVSELSRRYFVPLSGILRHKDVISEVTGKANSTLCPGKNFPFAELLNRIVMPFYDLDPGYPYLNEIEYLKKKGILVGNGGNLKPKNWATREEVALMIFRLLKSLNL